MKMKREYFAKGKRGFIYTSKYKGKKVAIKAKNPKSEAKGRILNEGKMLEVLNKINIGPELISFTQNEVMYYFVDGQLILDYIKNSTQSQITKTLLAVMDQCYAMDDAGIVKEEMTRPVKHILVTKRKPVMIDFERAHYSNKPHNVTQFIQFLTRLKEQLRPKGIFINTDAARRLSREYKKNRTKKNYERLKNLFELRTPFQTKVLLKLTEIPEGKVTTYADVAKAIKSDAIRAVGSAIKTNPCSPEIPCHRVIKNDGSLGQYTSKNHTKEELLKKEKVTVSNGKIDLKKYRHNW